MKLGTAVSITLGLYLSAGLGAAADQTVLGRTLIVKDPGTAQRRKVRVVGSEKNSPNTIVGNPAIDGATLRIVLDGAIPSDTSYPLPQGTSLSGKPFWRPNSAHTGFRYKDARGEQGPVKALSLRAAPTGQFGIKGSLQGKNGPIDSVPPNPGSEAWVTLTIGGGGDRYCIQFGLDSIVTNKDGKLFKAKKATVAGCPASPSGAFLGDDPGAF